MLPLLVMKMQKNSTEKKIWEKKVYAAAIKYIAENFKVPISNVKRDSVFGLDLKQKSRPSLSEDIYEDLRFDFVLILDKKTRKEFESGRLKINTVDEFCDQVIRCYRLNKSTVSCMLNLTLGKRRCILFHLRKMLKNGRARKIFYIIKRFLYS